MTLSYHPICYLFYGSKHIAACVIQVSLVAMQKSQVSYFAAYSAHIPPPPLFPFRTNSHSPPWNPCFGNGPPAVARGRAIATFSPVFFFDFLRKAIDKFSRIATGKEYLCTNRESSHCNENLIYVFLFWELCGLSPNFCLHVSVSDLYILRIGPHIFLQQNRQTDPGNIWISYRYMSVRTGRQNIIILFWK